MRVVIYFCGGPSCVSALLTGKWSIKSQLIEVSNNIHHHFLTTWGTPYLRFSLFFLVFIFLKICITVALKCSVNCCRTAKWPPYTFIYILFFLIILQQLHIGWFMQRWSWAYGRYRVFHLFLSPDQLHVVCFMPCFTWSLWASGFIMTPIWKAVCPPRTWLELEDQSLSLTWHLICLKEQMASTQIWTTVW